MPNENDNAAMTWTCQECSDRHEGFINIDYNLADESAELREAMIHVLKHLGTQLQPAASTVREGKQCPSMFHRKPCRIVRGHDGDHANDEGYWNDAIADAAYARIEVPAPKEAASAPAPDAKPAESAALAALKVETFAAACRTDGMPRIELKYGTALALIKEREQDAQTITQQAKDIETLRRVADGHLNDEWTRMRNEEVKKWRDAFDKACSERDAALQEKHDLEVKLSEEKLRVVELTNLWIAALRTRDNRANRVRQAVRIWLYDQKDKSQYWKDRLLETVDEAAQPAADEAPAPEVELLKKCAVALNYRGTYDDAQVCERRIREVGREVDAFLHDVGVEGYGQ